MCGLGEATMNLLRLEYTSELRLEMRWGSAEYLQATWKGSFSLITVCVLVGNVCCSLAFPELEYYLKRFYFLAVVVRN